MSPIHFDFNFEVDSEFDRFRATDLVEVKQKD